MVKVFNFQASKLVTLGTLGLVFALGMCLIQQNADYETTVSWLTWFSGKSISFEFHFLDLLELLTRSS